ncbi:hypothetical protein GCM10025866_06520 [Naasia aerilata]|uniref:RNA helicase HrpA C-terminal domain-containing protein n=1 Tax=Naasia aerilata TaxID=1162966 RepID=A0ABM8G981_9MICO|nr:hypothetical protein GCM10025866_06520 [Naasia aerilata]
MPGLREELVTALIKTLPKSIRRTVVPAADWAARLLADLPSTPTEEPITAALASAIRRANGTPVTADDFDPERLPGHLRPNFAVLDERGRRLGVGKDLAGLQTRHATQARESVSKLFGGASGSAGSRRGGGNGSPRPGRPDERPPLERTGLTTWDFDDLPRELDVRRGGSRVRAYPALVDTGAAVDIRLFGTPAEQASAHRNGVRRLLQLATPSPVSYLNEHLTGAEKVALATSPYPNVRALFDDALTAVIDARLRTHAPDALLWTRGAFEEVRADVSAHVVDDLFGAVALAARVLTASREADAAIRAATSLALLPALTDARGQLDALVYPGFVSATGLEQLRRVPVYLAGIAFRVGKLAENPGRDRVWQNEVQTATERYVSAGGTLPLPADADPRLARVRWMLEELRLSLFAQQLGAAGPVSLQRIARALAD